MQETLPPNVATGTLVSPASTVLWIPSDAELLDLGPEVQVAKGQNPAKRRASRETSSVTTPAVLGLQCPDGHSVKVVLEEIPADDPCRSLLVADEPLSVQPGDP